jgi:hypothetical protein
VIDYGAKPSFGAIGSGPSLTSRPTSWRSNYLTPLTGWDCDNMVTNSRVVDRSGAAEVVPGRPWFSCRMPTPIKASCCSATQAG